MRIARFSALLILLCGLSGCWRRSPAGQTYVTAASIEAAISSDFNNQIQAIGGVGENWKILSDQEYDALILRVAKNRVISGPAGWHSDMVLTDAWGHRL